MPERLKRLADSVRKDAEEYKDTFCKDYEDKVAFQGDVDDLLEIASLIEKGEIVKAQRKADNLDTFVRECINDKAWNFLHFEFD